MTSESHPLKAATATVTFASTTHIAFPQDQSIISRNNDSVAAAAEQYDDTSDAPMTHKNKRMRQLPSPEKCADAIQALNRAVARKDCITAITQACSLFDHNDQEWHDFEIQKGAHIALFKLLSIVLSRASKSDGSSDSSHVGYKGDEVQQLCRSLEMVHRCSTRCILLSFDEVGEDLIDIILHVIERCMDNVIRDDSDVGAVSSLKVLLYYSDGQNIPQRRAIKYMANRPGLMSLLLRVAASDNFVDERGKEVALKIIANLDYSRSTHKRNLSSTDILLLDTLIENSFHPSADAVRNNAALGLNNLSCHNEHIATMIEERVLEALLRLLRDDNSLTRQYAASTVKNLAKVRENAVVLVNHGYGSLLEELIKIIESDDSDEARRSASRALRDVACTETAAKMANEHLLKALANIILSDTKANVREESAHTLKQLSYNINAPTPSHGEFLTALIKATFSDEMRSLSIIGKALLVQSSESQNRPYIMEQKQLFAGLANMSAFGQHNNVAGILRNLAYDNDNKETLATDEVFEMLSSAVAISGEASKYAVRAISHLSTSASNKVKLANYRGLVEALVKMCRSTSDVTLRTWARNILLGLMSHIGA